VSSAAHTPGRTGSDAVAQARRWYWQRISAMVLALCVLVHLAVMVYAVRGGLSAAEILSRTQGNWASPPSTPSSCWPARCTCRMGLANIAREWWRWSPRRALWFARRRRCCCC
jgi:fumarate reductase subunit C